MSFGIRTFDAQGRETFNMEMPVIRQETLQYLPANSSGTIDMSPYLGGTAAVRFIPTNYHTFQYVVQPYARMVGSTLYWYTAGSPFYAVITGVVR